jgi:hypothetical protein
VLEAASPDMCVTGATTQPVHLQKCATDSQYQTPYWGPRPQTPPTLG